jgi:hypothetical protein
LLRCGLRLPKTGTVLLTSDAISEGEPRQEHPAEHRQRLRPRWNVERLCLGEEAARHGRRRHHLRPRSGYLQSEEALARTLRVSAR